YDTARVNQLAIERLALEPSDAVLELGFGHGRTLLQVAGRTRQGFVAGVDPSEVMLRHARMRNGRYIDQGRLVLHLGESAHIPYPDDRFDKAFAVHVLYFWSDPRDDLREIHRVLRSGGLLLLGFRPKDDPRVVADLPQTVYKLYTLSEVKKLLEESGFHDARCEVETLRGRQIAWATAHA
ncbi:MAG: class I SAM-dependent methyltransferase, partial [Myxococcota bacterium]